MFIHKPASQLHVSRIDVIEQLPAAAEAEAY